MKYHSFYMRVLCLILIIGAVLGYNFMQKNDTQAQEITELTDRVSALEEQQQEMLTALEDAAKAQEEAKAAAANASSKEKFTSLSTRARANGARCAESVTNGVNASNNGIFVLTVVCVENISAFCSAISVIVESNIVSKSPFPC